MVALDVSIVGTSIMAYVVVVSFGYVLSTKKLLKSEVIALHLAYCLIIGRNKYFSTPDQRFKITKTNHYDFFDLI